jgi:hypothetical protein
VNILRPVTYVLASLASVCVIVASVYAYSLVQRVGEALRNLSNSSAVSAPVNPGPPEGMSDDELKATLDQDCVRAHPNDWKTMCAS